MDHHLRSPARAGNGDQVLGSTAEFVLEGPSVSISPTVFKADVSSVFGYQSVSPCAVIPSQAQVPGCNIVYLHSVSSLHKPRGSTEKGKMRRSMATHSRKVHRQFYKGFAKFNNLQTGSHRPPKKEESYLSHALGFAEGFLNVELR